MTFSISFKEYASISEFKKLEDLNIYANHPEHLKVGEFVGKVREDRKAVDYEF